MLAVALCADSLVECPVEACRDGSSLQPVIQHGSHVWAPQSSNVAGEPEEWQFSF